MGAVAVTGLTGGPVAISERDLEAFAAEFCGSIVLPGSPGFDDAVSIWNGAIRATPSIVVRPASAADVGRAIDLARTRGLALSIKGGGCNIAGTALVDGGLTLDMCRMKGVEVDEERRLAHVGPGCLIGDVEPVTQRFGLATVFGLDMKTGIAGSTLGGGLGNLTRCFGCGADNIVELQVVTADGRLRRAAGDENEDLFWALRGGDGNFGAVATFTFRLHAIRRQITGGMIIWDGERAEDVIGAYRRLAGSAPREMTLTLIMRLAPPVPFIPKDRHRKPIVGVLACHVGELSRAEEELKPLRDLGHPIIDAIRQRTYADQQTLLGKTQPPVGLHQYWKSEFLPGLSDAVLARFLEHGKAIESPTSQAMMFHLGGALGDRAAEDTAFANRDAAFAFIAAGSWPAESRDCERHRDWVLSAWRAIEPYSTGGNYVNVQTDDEDDSRIREAYRGNFERLRRTKATYDPENLFRRNRNIPPAD